MPIVNVSGAPHAYDISALPTAGETLVFLHGWLLSRSYWQPLVDQLSDRCRCITYDARGFGDSIQSLATGEDTGAVQTRRSIQLPSDRTWYPSHSAEQTVETSIYSLAAYAQDLGDLLDQLDIDRVWLMGHSLGGSVALWAAYLFPERVKGVICLNAGGGIYIPKEFEKFRAAGQQMVKFRPQWLAQVPLLPRVFCRAMVHKTLALQWGQQRIRDFVQADRAAAVGALLESTTCEEVHQLPQLMSQLTQPVHFITASQDTIMPPRYVRYLASFHPHFCEAEMVSEISDCGHMAMVEQPQAVASVVKSVLSVR